MFKSFTNATAKVYIDGTEYSGCTFSGIASKSPLQVVDEDTSMSLIDTSSFVGTINGITANPFSAKVVELQFADGTNMFRGRIAVDVRGANYWQCHFIGGKSVEADTISGGGGSVAPSDDDIDWTYGDVPSSALVKLYYDGSLDSGEIPTSSTFHRVDETSLFYSETWNLIDSLFAWRSGANNVYIYRGDANENKELIINAGAFLGTNVTSLTISGFSDIKLRGGCFADSQSGNFTSLTLNSEIVIFSRENVEGDGSKGIFHESLITDLYLPKATACIGIDDALADSASEDIIGTRSDGSKIRIHVKASLQSDYESNSFWSSQSNAELVYDL